MKQDLKPLQSSMPYFTFYPHMIKEIFTDVAENLCLRHRIVNHQQYDGIYTQI